MKSGVRRGAACAPAAAAADDSVATDLAAVDTRCTSLARGHAQLKRRSESVLRVIQLSYLPSIGSPLTRT